MIRPTLVQQIADIGERAFLVLLAIPFLWAFAKALPTHPTLILLCISEMLGVILIVIRRSGALSLGPLAVLSAFCGTALPLLVRPGGVQICSTLVSTVLMSLGLALCIVSKLYLNRSFGLIAANRGVKSRGPYRLVRHPMYLGYMVNQLGFLTANLSILNSLIYLLAWSFQILRVIEEEAVLQHDEAYRHFAQRVRSRLIPGLY